tara:strand:- start:5 stop:349 length:345 start_codon:yes stop_codon:yes gene_type:complete
MKLYGEKYKIGERREKIKNNMRLFALILEGITKMKEQDKKPKRNLHTIVVDALGNYSYPIFMTKIFKKDVADKVCKDFCEEYYPSEPTTADEFNKEYLNKKIKGSRDGYWELKQ